MTDPQKLIADFEKQGEAAVRHWGATSSPLDADQVVKAHAVAWLKEKEIERTANSTATKEAREVETLSIARQSLSNSRQAKRIAILALVLNIVLALKLVADAYSK